MRGVFFGTSEFALPALRAFARSVEVRLVVTQPARPAGRGGRTRPSAVALAAEELALPVLAPERLREALATLRELGADCFAVASYGRLLPAPLLALAPLGALNVHPSLLPLYRGATPLQAQLRDGVVESGVSVIAMDAGMDSGDIVLQERSAIGPQETYGELHDRFAELGARLLARACEQLADGTLVRRPQTGLASEDRIAGTLTHPLSNEDLLIDRERTWSAKRIVDAVRAYAPRPLARSELVSGERVKLLDAHLLGEHAASLALPPDGRWATNPAVPGAILSRRADGIVAVERLIPPNRGATEAAAYLRSRRAAAPA
ncbi:MAG: methionyl-tRNA formyltransferase [Vulcanimicrobiaceae bacterium]